MQLKFKFKKSGSRVNAFSFLFLDWHTIKVLHALYVLYVFNQKYINLDQLLIYTYLDRITAVWMPTFAVIFLSTYFSWSLFEILLLSHSPLPRAPCVLRLIPVSLKF